MQSKTIEQYIEVIYALEKELKKAHTTDIASILKLAPASVTEMVQKLRDMALVNYEPYHGVTLTVKGKKMAEELMQKHRTLAEFLNIIGVEKSYAEIDACQIEHHVSSQTIEKLNKFVEFVREAPQDPRWLAHFKHYCETGERLICEKLC
jgi:DtxR family Mn-dependent transcriptional regulator